MKRKVIPSVIWEECVALAQLRNELHPTHNPKQHPDLISRFTAIHFTDTQTDTHRQTGRPTHG